MTCSRTLPAIVAAMACALLTAPAALAAIPTTTTARGEDTPLNLDRVPAAEHASGGGGGIVRTIVGLAVVIGVILGLHWLLKQIKGNREGRSSGGGLQPISTLALGAGRSLHLVRAGSEIVLVGSADHGVTPIRVYREDEARALGLLDDNDGDERDGGDPLKADPASPPLLFDLIRRFQRRTVRG